MTPGPRATVESDRARRRRAYRFGHWGELACRWRLRAAGWRILAANWRSPSGEIDIVARRGRLVAFVEVKSRREMSAAAAPTPRQRRRIARAAEIFLAQHAALSACFGRFDVMFVAPFPRLRFFWPIHVADAWRPDDAPAGHYARR